MAERMTVFEPGDRLATLAEDGVARTWVVSVDGDVVKNPGNVRDGTRDDDSALARLMRTLVADGAVAVSNSDLIFHEFMLDASDADRAMIARLMEEAVNG